MTTDARGSEVSTTKRLASAAVFVVGLVVLALVLPLPFVDRMPDPVATHWGANGVVNGTSRRGGFAVNIVATMLCVGAVVGAVAAFLPPRAGTRALGTSRLARGLLLLGIALGAAPGTVAAIVSANVGAGSALEADAPVLLVLALVLGGVAVSNAVLLSLLAATFGRSLPYEGADRPEGLPVRPGEHQHWVSGARNRGITTFAAALALLPLEALVGGPIPIGALVVPGVVGVGLLCFSGVRVAVDDQEVAIDLGPLRWPRRHISRDRIVAASVVDIRPLEWGGWGWRGIPGRTAIVIRKGEGMQLDLGDGHSLVVTVDDARRGAALINSRTASAA
jgi:hypothetical protein